MNIKQVLEVADDKRNAREHYTIIGTVVSVREAPFTIMEPGKKTMPQQQMILKDSSGQIPIHFLTADAPSTLAAGDTVSVTFATVVMHVGVNATSSVFQATRIGVVNGKNLK